MAVKLKHLLFFFALITLTVQRQLRYYGDTRGTDNILKLLSNLKTQAYVPKTNRHHTEEHSHLGDRHSHTHTHTDTVHSSRNTDATADDYDQVTLDVFNRMCKIKGKCCNGECRLTVDEYQGTSEEEITSLMDELNRDLAALEGSEGVLRCGCQKKKKCDTCGRTSLRCGCGRGRSGDGEEESWAVGRLRCEGGRCGVSVDNDDVSPTGLGEERCTGYRCSRGRTASRDLASQLDRHGTKYKINDDLDAIFVDASELDGILNQLTDNSGKNKRKRSRSKVDRSRSVSGVDELTDIIRNVKAQPDVEAVIVDLSQVKNNDDLAYYLKSQFNPNQRNEQTLSPEDLTKYYLKMKKNIIELATEYVHGGLRSDKLNFLPSNVLARLNRLKTQLARGEDYTSYELLTEINRIVFEEDSESRVLPHRERNNNDYIPKWAHGAALQAKDTYKVQKTPLATGLNYKTLNKNDLYRRETKRDSELYGVPFDLRIDGLGQINP